MLTAGWGHYPLIDAKTYTFDTENELRRILEKVSPGKSIARGLGRSYGDSSLAENLISTRRLNRFVAFNDATGELVCEAGVSLAEILDVFAPRGWFLPVTPGTKFVTIGGAVASDVHGKNHHKVGSFSNHVRWIELLLADGSVARCSKTQNPELFRATCAGYGLTGVILRVALQLQKIETAYIRQRTVRTGNLDEVLAAFDEHANWSYSVAWIDCLARGGKLGRSVLMLGEHATRNELPATMPPFNHNGGVNLGVPFTCPDFVLNSFMVRSFNAVYYAMGRPGHRLVSYEPYFYPLDNVRNWSRIYGRRGFVQYQLVIPKEPGEEGLKKILAWTAARGMGSFLAVLKLFGREDGPYLSFAKEGYTLALDFPITPLLFEQLKELDTIVKDYAGRLYPTKDSRMGRDMIRSGYPNLDKFLEVRAKVDPARKFDSLQSRRLGL